MNWAASLGIGPGLLALGTGLRVVPSFAGMVIPNRRELQEAHLGRAQRTRAESTALRQRIRARLAAGHNRTAIAIDELVSVAYVDKVAQREGLTSRATTALQRKATTEQARAMLRANPGMKKGDVAKALGLTACNLSHLFKRYPADLTEITQTP